MSKPYESQDGWVRVLFTVLFWIIFYLSQFVVGIVILAQCIFSLVTGKPNEQLLKFGDSLGKYVHEILRYTTFNTERRPFPFDDFPKADIVIPVNEGESA